MEELIIIFNELEDMGWVCLLKWDGERNSNKKTIVISFPNKDEFYRSDFDNFEKQVTSIKRWLLDQGVKL